MILLLLLEQVTPYHCWLQGSPLSQLDLLRQLGPLVAVYKSTRACPVLMMMIGSSVPRQGTQERCARLPNRTRSLPNHARWSDGTVSHRASATTKQRTLSSTAAAEWQRRPVAAMCNAQQKLHKNTGSKAQQEQGKSANHWHSVEQGELRRRTCYELRAGRELRNRSSCC